MLINPFQSTNFRKIGFCISLSNAISWFLIKVPTLGQLVSSRGRGKRSTVGQLFFIKGAGLGSYSRTASFIKGRGDGPTVRKLV